VTSGWFAARPFVLAAPHSWTARAARTSVWLKIKSVIKEHLSKKQPAIERWLAMMLLHTILLSVMATSRAGAGF
jgi:hypothetical protein